MNPSTPSTLWQPTEYRQEGRLSSFSNPQDNKTCSVLYGAHFGRFQTLSDIHPFPTAVALEGVFDISPALDPNIEGVEFRHDKGPDTGILKEVAEKRLQLYHLDFAIGMKNISIDAITMATRVITAGILTRDMIENDHTLIRIAEAIAACYAMLPTGSMATTVASYLSNRGRSFAKAVDQLVTTVSMPKYLPAVQQARNIVIAYKAKTIMHDAPQGTHLLLSMGGLHIGLEKALEQPKEKLLQSLSSLTRVFRLSIRDTVPNVIRFEHEENISWKIAEVYQIPELKALVS